MYILDRSPEQRLLFSVAAAADVLGVGISMVKQLIHTGRLASVKVGGRRLIPRASLEKFVAELQSESTAASA